MQLDTLLEAFKSASFWSCYIKNACIYSFYVSDILKAQLHAIFIWYKKSGAR